MADGAARFSDGVLEAISADLSAHLTALGIDDARGTAAAVVARLATDWGGQQIYIPRRSRFVEAVILAEFTGNNVPELVKKYRMSRSAIYRIINRARVNNNILQQAVLPGVTIKESQQ